MQPVLQIDYGIAMDNFSESHTGGVADDEDTALLTGGQHGEYRSYLQLLYCIVSVQFDYKVRSTSITVIYNCSI